MRSAVLGFCFVVLVAMFTQIALVRAAPVSSSRAVEERICYGDCSKAAVVVPAPRAPVSEGSSAVEKRICYGDCREAVVDPAESTAPAAPVASSPSPVAEPLPPLASLPVAEPLPPSPSPSDPSPESADADSVPPPAPVLASPTVLAPVPTEQELLSMVNTMLQLIQAYEVNKAAPAASPSAS